MARTNAHAIIGLRVERPATTTQRLIDDAARSQCASYTKYTILMVHKKERRDRTILQNNHTNVCISSDSPEQSPVIQTTKFC
ncbi:hypothetical protein QR680_018712 [Steinernema hermaphroditum]|uniref:Uncharacterized protein n=1 Tax=Steinernema hermaphroditum TaxID=289476 RepID=A0AA39LRF8_9BILA|nr:hypothetical protein QR680_018712 [Steinernema hermaphroditum]